MWRRNIAARFVPRMKFNFSVKSCRDIPSQQTAKNLQAAEIITSLTVTPHFLVSKNSFSLNCISICAM